MATTSTSLEPPAARTITLEIELSADANDALRDEHERLSRDANPTLTWDRFLHACLAIGLDRLSHMDAEEALDRLDRLET